MIRLGGVNLIGVVAATVAMLVLSFIWYGLAFREAWLAANRFTPADFASQHPLWGWMGIAIPLILSFGLGWLMKRADIGSPGAAMVFCALVALLIGVPIHGYTLVYGPWHSLAGFAIDGGHTLLSFALAGIILAYFE
jgi:hypothetical protein